MSTAAYRPVDGARVHPFDSGAGEATFVLESAAGRRWQVNAATAQLIEALASAPTLESAAAELQEKWERPVEPGALREYLDRVLVPAGMVVAPAGSAAAALPPPRRPGGRLASMSVRRTLLGARAVERLSGPLRHLYHPLAFWPLFLALVGAAVWVLAAHVLRTGDTLALMVAPEAVVVALLGTFVHEVGHAAACRRFGARHGGLGVGLYLVFPVLYMELDEAWRLPRMQRAIVDMGGLFLQLLFGLAMMGAGLVWPALMPAAAGGMALTGASLAANLNPFFRFDGYWLASDLLGIPNLRANAGRMLARGWARLRGRPAGADPLLPGGLRPRTARLLAAYAVLSTAFMAYFFGKLALFLPDYVAHGYPALMARQLAALGDAVRDPAPLRALALLVSVITPTALVVGLPLALALMLRSLAARALRRARATRPVPSGAVR